MNETDILARLQGISITAAKYCYTIENCREIERDEFINSLTVLLPRLYLDFTEMNVDEYAFEQGDEFFQEYVDESLYEYARKGVESVLGEEDVYLETHEEDMKYSETPISATISESLADIFQPLYNFCMIYKESEGENGVGAFIECQENFKNYWAQAVCNVMRPLNHLKYKF